MVVQEFIEDIAENPAEEKTIRNVWKWIKRGVYGLVGFVGLCSMPYIISPDSMGVVKRFGKYVRTTEPGIHLKLPYWVETVDRVPVKKIQKVEFGFRTLEAGVDSKILGAENTREADESDLSRVITESGESTSWDRNSIEKKAAEILKKEYAMLTGDLNMADVEWIVQYRIKDAEAYLFNVREPVHTIRDCSQAVMRQLIGNGSVDEAITIGRVEYESSAKEGLQELLDKYDTGIHVVTVKLQSSNPPIKVRPAFNEVNAAMQFKEKRINEAKKEYNEAVPKARGEAQGLVKKAEGYALERVNMSKGDVGKFERVYAEYAKAPEITRRRMYLETMEKLLPQIDEKWIIEQKGAEGGILMKLDLEKGQEVIQGVEQNE
jgi:membrane protease subunit HflK